MRGRFCGAGVVCATALGAIPLTAAIPAMAVIPSISRRVRSRIESIVSVIGYESAALGGMSIWFSLMTDLRFWWVVLVRSIPDCLSVTPNSLGHVERAVRDKFRIHYADLDPAVGSTRLFAVARNARIGFAKTLGGLA